MNPRPLLHLEGAAVLIVSLLSYHWSQGSCLASTTVFTFCFAHDRVSWPPMLDLSGHLRQDRIFPPQVFILNTVSNSHHK